MNGELSKKEKGKKEARGSNVGLKRWWFVVYFLFDAVRRSEADGMKEESRIVRGGAGGGGGTKGEREGRYRERWVGELPRSRGDMAGFCWLAWICT